MVSRKALKSHLCIIYAFLSTPKLLVWEIVLFYSPMEPHACPYFSISYAVHCLLCNTVGYLRTGTMYYASQEKKKQHDLAP